MRTRSMTGNPSQIMVEQLAASGVRYVFNNSGSREAAFFDALHTNPRVHGILALHEGSVTAMAMGYTQAGLNPAVMLVHLGAGLAQSLGQLINAWFGGLPVVVITFAGDTGSFADRINLDLDHSFGPTSISAPFTKASWTVIEPEGLPQAIHRALRTAVTPPAGPVHVAVYDRLIFDRPVTADIIEGEIGEVRAGGPSEVEVEAIARALQDAERPLLYVGDGVWKSGAGDQVESLAQYLGAPVAGDMHSVSMKHPLHCGSLGEAVAALDPDSIVCIGVLQQGSGLPQDFRSFQGAADILALGSAMENITCVPGADLAVLADERQTIQRVLQVLKVGNDSKTYAQRRAWVLEQAAALRAERSEAARGAKASKSVVRPWKAVEYLDQALERLGGGLITTEQFSLPLSSLGGPDGAGNNVYLPPPGGSEGYGVGAPIGLKLAAPDRPVVGLVGDGSLYYADSGLWTSVHHKIPVLYVVPNNQAYGIVAGHFGQAAPAMSESGVYAGVALQGIDPVKIADGFGMEAMRVEEESRLQDAVDHGLKTVQDEGRPFLLDIRVPLGLPHGGRPATPYHLRGDGSESREG